MQRIREIDFPILITTLLIALVGVIMIYSAAYYSDSASVQSAWNRQAKFAISSKELFNTPRIIFGDFYEGIDVETRVYKQI